MALMEGCYLSLGFRVPLFLEVQGSCLQLMSGPPFSVSFRVGISTLLLRTQIVNIWDFAVYESLCCNHLSPPLQSEALLKEEAGCL